MSKKHLFIDLDDTLIKSIPNRILPHADYYVRYNGKIYSTFLRHDISELRGIPSVIFTASPLSYAKIHSEILKSKGFKVQGLLHRNHLFGNPMKNVEGYLLDNSKLISNFKSRILPKVEVVILTPIKIRDGKSQTQVTSGSKNLKSALSSIVNK